MNLKLENYSTFKVGGNAYKILNIRKEDDIISAVSYAEKCNKRLIVIGEGSNSIFSDEDDLFIIGHMQLTGISIKEDTDLYSVVRVAAGESWDNLVSWSIEQGLSGIEALSGIPGTVGAAPIQNIGAYGRELSDVLVNVTAYNLEEKRFRSLKSSQCEFSYRDSIFKRNPDKYIISEITIKLYKTKPRIPDYESVKNKFTTKSPTLSEIRDVILRTRAEKIPDYKTVPNCGSFFKNPIITQDEFKKIQDKYPDIPFFETKDNMIKIYTGWLIEHSDYKQYETSNISFYNKNKLVLTNTNEATFEELLMVIKNITEEIYKNFKVHIEPEPNLFK